MKLVLQCAMCGTHHPVGTPVCSTCRASGVTQLRLMFECPSCGRLDLNPVCETCPRPAQSIYELDDELIVAEEVADDPFALELDALDPVGELPLELDTEVEEDIFVVDLSEGEEDDSDFEDSDLDSELEGPDDADIEFDPEDELDEEEDDFDQDLDDEDEEEE